VIRICRPATVVIAVSLALGCASSSSKNWEKAQKKDTSGAYHRFLRDNPRSDYVDEAKERLAFHRLMKDPTAEGYEEFRAEYPLSPLSEQLMPVVEDRVFEQVRARGTIAAYREFLADFPTSSHAERARGNAEYLENRGFAGNPSELAAFAERHPTSDFADEALRSVSLVETRQQRPIRSIGLILEVDPSTPGASQLRRTFAERAGEHYAKSHVKVVSLASASDPRVAEVDALLTIEHHEAKVRAQITEGVSSSAGVVATTNATLERPGEAVPIRKDEFSHKVPLSEYKSDKSIVFGASGVGYWQSFFFADATWSNNLATRSEFDVKKSGVAIEMIDHRAAVLFENGSFELVDLSDPDDPQVITRYTRSRDLTKWSGLRNVAGRIAIFGDGGFEIVELSATGPKKVVAFDRATVGSIVAVEDTGEGLLLAGSRGLMLLASGATEPRLLVDQHVLGAGMHGGRVYFIVGSSLFTSSLPMLMRNKAEGELPIGSGFGAKRVRIWGNVLVAMGTDDVLLVDVSRPSAPRIRSRITAVDRGEIRDAIAMHGQLYLLSDRGLLVSSLRDGRTHDAVGLAALNRMSFAGRHLVTVGDSSLQVVDTTPFAIGSSPAKPLTEDSPEN
jgi:hypothetical protein